MCSHAGDSASSEAEALVDHGGRARKPKTQKRCVMAIGSGGAFAAGRTRMCALGAHSVLSAEEYFCTVL